MGCLGQWGNQDHLGSLGSAILTRTHCLLAFQVGDWQFGACFFYGHVGSAFSELVSRVLRLNSQLTRLPGTVSCSKWPKGHMHLLCHDRHCQLQLSG